MSAATLRYPAPAVQFPLRRSAVLGSALALLHLAALLVLWAWLGRGAGAERSAAGPALLLWAATAALAARFWARRPVGLLSWDGQTWELRRAHAPAAVQALGSAVVIQLDLQRRMALAFPQARPVVWLFVERSEEASRWLDLRRAVYSRAKALPSEQVAQEPGESTFPDRRD